VGWRRRRRRRRRRSSGLAGRSLTRQRISIGNQSRPQIFDLEIRRPELLYSAVVEADERVVLMRAEANEEERARLASLPGRELTGVTGERVKVIEPLNEAALRCGAQEGV
jgi:5-oxoprolinase (ATP-hydrolysing)